MEIIRKTILIKIYCYIERNHIIQKKTLIIQKVYHTTKLHDTKNRMINKSFDTKKLQKNNIKK